LGISKSEGGNERGRRKPEMTKRENEKKKEKRQ
jgi:hypothetical protein